MILYTVVLVLGAIAGIFMAFARSQLQPVVTSALQLKTIADFPVFGLVSHTNKDALIRQNKKHLLYFIALASILLFGFVLLVTNELVFGLTATELMGRFVMSTIEKALDKLLAQEPTAAQAPAADATVTQTPPVIETSTSVEVVQAAVQVEAAVQVASVPVESAPHVQQTALQPDPQPVLQAQPQPVVPSVASTALAESAKVEVAEVKSSTQRPELFIDFTRLSELNFVSLATERRLISEEYRVIKRKLINNAFGPLSSTLNHPNLILVSSTRPGEGKTFTSVNLALSIALEQDKTVLLVDTDVLRPNVARTLDIQVPVGLTDYLSGDDVKVNDILYSTNVERLKIIAAGRPHHLSTELFSQRQDGPH